jgi:hypothetical protein
MRNNLYKCTKWITVLCTLCFKILHCTISFIFALQLKTGRSIFTNLSEKDTGGFFASANVAANANANLSNGREHSANLLQFMPTLRPVVPHQISLVPYLCRKNASIQFDTLEKHMQVLSRCIFVKFSFTPSPSRSLVNDKID